MSPPTGDEIGLRGVIGKHDGNRRAGGGQSQPFRQPRPPRFPDRAPGGTAGSSACAMPNAADMSVPVVAAVRYGGLITDVSVNVIRKRALTVS